MARIKKSNVSQHKKMKKKVGDNRGVKSGDELFLLRILQLVVC